MLSLPGDESALRAPPDLHGLTETTSNLGVGGADTAWACNPTLDNAANTSVTFTSISSQSPQARADGHFEGNQLVGSQVAVVITVEHLQRRDSVIDLPR